MPKELCPKDVEILTFVNRVRNALDQLSKIKSPRSGLLRGAEPKFAAFIDAVSLVMNKVETHVYNSELYFDSERNDIYGQQYQALLRQYTETYKEQLSTDDDAVAIIQSLDEDVQTIFNLNALDERKGASPS